LPKVFWFLFSFFFFFPRKDQPLPELLPFPSPLPSPRPFPPSDPLLPHMKITIVPSASSLVQLFVSFPEPAFFLDVGVPNFVWGPDVTPLFSRPIVPNPLEFSFFFLKLQGPLKPLQAGSSFLDLLEATTCTLLPCELLFSSRVSPSWVFHTAFFVFFFLKAASTPSNVPFRDHSGVGSARVFDPYIVSLTPPVRVSGMSIPYF